MHDHPSLLRLLQPTSVALGLALGLSFLTPRAFAQRPNSGAVPSPAERLERMAETLNLTQEQRSKVKAIMEKSGPEIREIMAKGRQAATESDRNKVRELLKAQSEGIAAILTPEQREKFKQTREQRTPPPLEERLQKMTAALSLTPDQQAKIKTIMETHGPKLREIMSKGRENASDADKEKAKDLLKQQFEEIGAILTPEQKAKFKDLRDLRAPGKPEEKSSN